MSASLVGSEMCIRDSATTEPVRGTSATRQAPIGHCRHTALQNVASNETVSYTHLTLPTICSV
eukprot:10327394-Alexandrium_andersonii.AAC.1